MMSVINIKKKHFENVYVSRPGVDSLCEESCDTLYGNVR